MKIRYSWLAVLTILATLVLLASPSSAAEFGGQAEDDTLVIRGTITSPGSAGSAPVAAPPSSLVTNCVPIGNGQLRCYTTDLAAGGGLIAAVSIIPGAAGPSAADIAAAVQTEFRRLPLVSGGIVIQPATGATLVNVDTIVLTDPAAQTFATSVLGIPISVRASPVRFAWTFGDGTAPLVTAEPGAPWPAPTVTHRYTQAGVRTISLSTEWAGEFQVAGAGAWQPIAGVATTTVSAPPLEVRSAANSLVAGP